MSGMVLHVAEPISIELNLRTNENNAGKFPDFTQWKYRGARWKFAIASVDGSLHIYK